MNDFTIFVPFKYGFGGAARSVRDSRGRDPPKDMRHTCCRGARSPWQPELNLGGHLQRNVPRFPILFSATPIPIFADDVSTECDSARAASPVGSCSGRITFHSGVSPTRVTRDFLVWKVFGADRSILRLRTNGIDFVIALSIRSIILAG